MRDELEALRADHRKLLRRVEALEHVVIDGGPLPERRFQWRRYVDMAGDATWHYEGHEPTNSMLVSHVPREYPDPTEARICHQCYERSGLLIIDGADTLE